MRKPAGRVRSSAGSRCPAARFRASFLPFGHGTAVATSFGGSSIRFEAAGVCSMVNRGCSVCCWWGGDGEVVEIFEGTGIRRAKVMAAGGLVEIAALGGGEIHLGDRIDLAWPRPVADNAPRASLDGTDVLEGDDSDPFSEW